MSWIHLELIYKSDSCQGSDFMFPIFRVNCPSIICCLFHVFLHDFYVTSDVFQIPYSCGPGSVLSVPLSLSVYWFILKVSKPHCLNYCVLWTIVLLLLAVPSSCRGGLLPCHIHGRLALDSTKETLIEVTRATSGQNLQESRCDSGESNTLVAE